METTAESISQLLALDAKVAADFEKSAYGRFDPRQIKSDLEKLKQQGFEIRKKTEEEIMQENGIEDRRGRNGKSREYTTAQKKQIVKKVLKIMESKKVTKLEACRMVGTSPKAFNLYRLKYGL